jgi:hypothetical protein
VTPNRFDAAPVFIVFSIEYKVHCYAPKTRLEFISSALLPALPDASPEYASAALR